jgi:hypothetical protein
MSPEVLCNDYPTEMSDMYGFCAVIWEIFNGRSQLLNPNLNIFKIITFFFFELLTARVPYASKCAEEIKCIVTIDDDFNNEKKIINNVLESVEFPFNRIVADGLSMNPLRRMKFQETRNELEHHLDAIQQEQVMKISKKKFGFPFR